MIPKRLSLRLAAVLVSAGVIGAGVLVYSRSAHPVPQPSPVLSDTAPPSRGAVPAPPAAGGGTAWSESLADILEAEGGQLTDVLAHLRNTCGLARPSRGERTAVDLGTRCVEDAEGTMSLVDLIRGSIEGPAAAGMPGDLRNRWEDTLVSARATVREMLTPVWDAVGRDLASGRPAPADFRALGHLRDRIGLVLSATRRP